MTAPIVSGAAAGVSTTRGRVVSLSHPAAYAIGTSLLSLLSIGITLLAPRLLHPADFGTFALLSSLFLYATKADLGLSQLADRELALKFGRAVEQDILAAFQIVGLFALSVVLPLIVLLIWTASYLPPLTCAAALAGGVLAMMANGPAAVEKAKSNVREFTRLALLLQAGMTAPRLGGLALAGVTGCFAALAAWYGLLVLLLLRRAPHARRRPDLVLLLRAALPLFAFNAAWLVYLTANRWIAAYLSTSEDLGQFAIGANLAMVGIGIISTVAQVRYPKLLTQIKRPGWDGSVLEREILVLGLGLAGVALLAVLLAPPLIPVIFPGYEASVPGVVAFALACVPLGIMAWIVPIALVLSPAALRDAAVMFGPCLAMLVTGMAVGNAAGGIDGQSWGCAAAALASFAWLLATLVRFAVIDAVRGIRAIAIQVMLVGILAGLAHDALTSPSEADIEGAAGPPLHWDVAFEDEFDSLDLWSSSTGTWEPHYPWGDQTNRMNAEMQYYVDPRPGRDSADVVALGGPEARHGTLVIRAREVPADLLAQTDGLPYVSGMVTTRQSFTFTYGYVEMRARLPQGKGLWPAFWLLPVDHSWPPEIDIMEVLGQDTGRLWLTMHSKAGGQPSKMQFQVATPDLSQALHVYGVKWTRDRVTWYLDRQAIASTSTPADMHGPMHLLVNLAVGGDWPGSPDGSTTFPADMIVDWIRVRLPPPDEALLDWRTNL